MDAQRLVSTGLIMYFIEEPTLGAQGSSTVRQLSCQKRPPGLGERASQTMAPMTHAAMTISIRMSHMTFSSLLVDSMKYTTTSLGIVQTATGSGRAINFHCCLEFPRYS